MAIVSDLWATLFALNYTQHLNYVAFAMLAAYASVIWVFNRLIGPSVWKGASAPASAEHNYGIEGIRGPLAFFVVFAHYLSVQNIIVNGSFGRMNPDHDRLASTAGLAVCYFFAITGYLFWRKFLRHPDTNVQRMFYARIYRIVPAFATLAVISLAIIIGLHLGELSQRPLSATFFQFASIFSLGMYDSSLSPWLDLFVGPTWTLRWELLFYATLPFLFTIRQTIGPWAFHIGLPVLLHYWSPGNEFLYIWFGCLAAEAAIVLERASPAEHMDRVLFVLAPPLFTFAFLRGEFSFSPWFGVEAAVVVIALARGSTFFGILRLPVMQVMGKISYSTYLFHGCVIFAAVSAIGPTRFSEFGNAGLLAVFVLLLPMILAASAVSYRFLEFPFLRASRRD